MADKIIIKVDGSLTIVKIRKITADQFGLRNNQTVSREDASRIITANAKAALSEIQNQIGNQKK